MILASIQNQILTSLISMINIFGIFIYYSYVWIKIYRVLCFTKLTFDQLPLFNPYEWPLSFIRVLTTPYFRFWSKLLPGIKIAGAGYDISVVVGLEFLNLLLDNSWHLRFICLLLLEKLIFFLEALKVA